MTYFLKTLIDKLENAKQMKSTAIENKLFPLGSLQPRPQGAFPPKPGKSALGTRLGSLVFRTFDNDDGGSNDNVKHTHRTFWCLSL